LALPGPLIPYIEAPVLYLRFLEQVPFLGELINPADPPALQPFGVLVLLGVIAGVMISIDRCRQRGLDTDKLTQFIFYGLGFGFVISHLLDSIFYHPQEVVADPLYLLMVHKGLSSYGGFVGAAVGAVVWRFRTKHSPMEFLDVTASAFPVAWVFGRTGCTVAHDHPGALSNAWFAVRFPDHLLAAGFDGRYDLGLIEMVLTVPLALAVTWLWRRQPKRAVGFYLGIIITAYAPVRFFLDFLRVEPDDPNFTGFSDPRYAGLTFAQWACFVGLALGLYLLSRSVGKPYVRTGPAAPRKKRKRRRKRRPEEQRG
jgi:phosphatidylglycerol---prolipoprotein diacylglyceryl transferase